MTGWKLYYYLPTCIVEWVSEYIFCLKNKQKNKHKHKQIQTKERHRKTHKKKQKKPKRKEEKNVVNHICGKSDKI